MCVFVAAENCKEFVNTLNTKAGDYHHIERANILADVFALFEKDGILKQYPLRIQFTGERAFDTGGVSRDMLEEFWKNVYMKYFDGATLLVPNLHAQSDMAIFQKLGTIMSHGYLFCHVLPTRIAFPCIAACLIGLDVQIADNIYLRSFIDYLSQAEQKVVKESITVKSNAFSKQVERDLINILDRFGIRENPNPGNLKQLLIAAGKYEFLTKPFAILATIHNGIPTVELQFWKGFSIEELHKLYLTLTASPAKILRLFEDPISQTPSEQRVFTYLQQFVGNLNDEDAGNFLRFVTGSSVCPSEKLKVLFSNTSGFARRPIAHTCGFSLELSTNYLNFADFSLEMKAVLQSEYSWIMDAI